MMIFFEVAVKEIVNEKKHEKMKKIAKK